MHPKDKRPGITLLEVVTVLAIGSALMMTGVGMVHTAMHSHANLARAQQQASDMQRLDERLRHDTHAATQVRLTDFELLLTTTVADPSAAFGEQDPGLIRYAVENQQLIRTQATQDGPTAREVFPINGRQLSWQIEELEGHTCVVVEVQRTEDQLLDYRLLTAIGQLPPNRPSEAAASVTQSEETRHER